MGDERDALLPLIPDDPVRIASDDHLDLRRFARTVAAAALGTRGPFVIGVYGDWGTGKSSVLRMARSLVGEQAKDVLTVWFNAWQTEHEEHPIAALVLAIERELTKRRWRARKGWKKLHNAAQAVACAVDLGVLDPSKAIEREEALAAKGREAVQVGVYGQSLQVLQEALSSLAGEQRPAVVVFVDDLDRCHRDNVLRVLDSLKAVFCEPGLVFVLGLNEAAIAECREDDDADDADPDLPVPGAAYHEKIIQVGLDIPPLRAQVDALVAQLVANPAYDEIPGLREQLNTFAPSIAAAAGYNVRKAKRLLNEFVLRHEVVRHGYRISGR